MALQISKTDSKGITTNYHRIDTVSLAGTTAYIKIKSYISEEYRLLEKTAQEKAAERMNLWTQIAAEMSKPEAERDTALIVTMTEQANALIQYDSNTDYSISSGDITLPFDKESTVSFESIYTQLKTLDEFAGATDI